MSQRQHRHAATVVWTGNSGSGTASPRAYHRSHVIEGPMKQTILGSADPAFRGDATAWNPEELLIAALAACHQLSYLHQCATHGVVVLSYRDAAEGMLSLGGNEPGRLTEVILRPEISIAAGSDPDKAHALHAEAHSGCFVANSVSFPVRVEPVIRVSGQG